MASSPPPQPLNQVCFISFSSSYHSHGRSKAQMCLKKIIDFISNEKLKVHKQVEEEEEVKVISYGKRGCGVDLNLRLGPCLELNNKSFSACSGVGGDDVEKVCDEIFTINNTCTTTSTIVDKSSEGEYDPQEEERVVVVLVDSETKELESSAITNNPSEIENQETQEQVEDTVNKLLEVEEEASKLSRRKEGYLDLLVEAAKLISGNFENVDDEETKVEVDDKNWMLECYDDFEDISPVVRSKRGRNQVLPYRYRDSVLEPWKRLTKQRSSRVCSKRSIR